MQRGLDNTLWDIQCHRCVQNAVRNPAERKQLYLRRRTETVKQRGVMFRPAFENHVGTHHLETKWENIPGREKKNEQRHRGMKIDLFSLLHKV